MAAFNLAESMRRAEQRMARPGDHGAAATVHLAVAELPEEVRATLFNLDLDASQSLPADVVAFYAFNHGATRALSFASGLPMPALLRAEAMTGWRPKSLALLRAIISFRGRDT